MPVFKKSAATDTGTIIARISALMPGVGLSVLITLVSLGVQHLEERVFGHPYLEALVIAILLGMGVVLIPASIFVFAWAENRAKRLGLLKRSG